MRKEEDMSSLWILSPVLVAWAAGAFLLIWSFREHLRQKVSKEQLAGSAKQIPAADTPDGLSREPRVRTVHGLAISALLAAALLALWVAWSGDGNVILFYLMKDIPIYFRIDNIGRWFVTLVTVVWVPVGIYSTLYMRHEGEEKRFFGFYLLLYGVLVCLDFAGNLVTMYLFYELMTLTSFPLVLHNGSREAIMACPSPPSKSVRPMDPANRVSPVNRVFPARSVTEPEVWPGVSSTSSSTPATVIRSPSFQGVTFPKERTVG